MIDYDDDVIFSIEITNGYVFRQIFELYDKLIISSIPIFFKESGVTIRSKVISTRDNTKLVSDIEIYTDDVLEYYINTDITTVTNKESENPYQIEKISMSTIKSILKSISKSNSIRLFRTTKDQDIKIQIKGLNIENAKINSSIYDNIDINILAIDQMELTAANIKIDIGQFCSMMKGVTRDTDKIVFKIYKNGIDIEGKNIAGTIIKNNSYGDISTLEYFECNTGVSFIKSLSKINSMVNYSIVKISSNRNGFIKFSHKVADFGEHNIYITGETNNDTDTPLNSSLLF